MYAYRYEHQPAKLLYIVSFVLNVFAPDFEIKGCVYRSLFHHDTTLN